MSFRPFSSDTFTQFLSKFKQQGFTLKDTSLSDVNTVTEPGIYTVNTSATGVPSGTSSYRGLLLHVRDTASDTTRHYDFQFFSAGGSIYSRARQSYSSTYETWNNWIRIQTPPGSPVYTATSDAEDLDDIKQELLRIQPGSTAGWVIVFGCSYEYPLVADNGVKFAGACLLTNSGENYRWMGVMRQEDGSLMSILVDGDALDSGDIEDGLTITATPIPRKSDLDKLGTYYTNSTSYVMINAAQKWSTGNTKALLKAYDTSGGLIYGGTLQWLGNSNGAITNIQYYKYAGSGSITATNNSGTIAFSTTPAFIEMHYAGVHD